MLETLYHSAVKNDRGIIDILHMDTLCTRDGFRCDMK